MNSSYRIPIRKNVDDPNYRYKMVPLIIKQSNVTKLINMELVAKDLGIRPDIPFKFIALELSTAHDDKNYILKGSFTHTKVVSLLEKFIEKYILCPSCQDPEMVMEVKDGKVCASCNACVWKGLLDNEHKIAHHIISNPPTNQSVFKNITKSKEFEFDDVKVTEEDLNTDDWDCGDDAGK